MAEIVMGGLPFCSDNRPTRRRRPLEAIKHFRLLVQDKESTEHVFNIIDALSGHHMRQLLRKSLETEEGRRAAELHQSLIPYLDDHEHLATLPEGSLGRAYLSFMTREGLTAAGLEAEQRKFKPETYDDLIQWWTDRARDVHDLIHVLTGYSRGALGELSNLAWTYGMGRGGLGDIFIAVMGAIEMKRWFPREPLFRVLYEGWQNGRKAKLLYIQDIEELFQRPLTDVQALLNIRPAPLYEATSARIMAHEAADVPGVPYSPVANG
ncbi:MAG: Coq4 family protein [Pseudomonadota bacterium]